MRAVRHSAALCRLPAALALAAMVAVPAAAGGTGVDGRLVTGDGPYAGGRVAAWADARMAGEPLAVSASSGKDGVYALDLPPGTYYLTATAGDLWAWCGQNPVTVNAAGKREWIGFILHRWQEPETASYPEGNGMDGRLSGRVLQDGKAVEGVTVSLYLDDSEGFRGAAYLRSAPTGGDGVFQMDLVPAGTYFLLARRRAGGRLAGPVSKGDLVGYYRGNPVRVEGGRELRLVLPLTAKKNELDIRAAAAFGRPGFAGMVLGDDGRPVAGVHVFAYTDPAMGHHQPEGISSVTGGDGRFTITLPGPGKYFVGARSGFGDSPAPGELFGFYDGTPDHSIDLGEEGLGRDIRVVVKKVLTP